MNPKSARKFIKEFMESVYDMRNNPHKKWYTEIDVDLFLKDLRALLLDDWPKKELIFRYGEIYNEGCADCKKHVEEVLK